MKATDGYIIDKLTINGRGGKSLEYRHVCVVVQNVGSRIIDGRRETREVILDGVLGMNLLLPSASGMANGMPTKVSEAPFARIVIDGPRGVLGLVKN
jgi:hypothetical protein